MTTEPMVKGAILREFVLWYEGKHGRERTRLLAARAPEDLRDLLDPDEPMVSILPATWYPARLVHSILDTLAEDMPERAVAQMAHDATRAIMPRGANSVYRFVLEKLVSPEVYARMVPRMWKQLHSTGERRMKILAPGRAESVVANWPGHHPLLCIITIETMCALFESMGCRDVRYHRVSCVSRGGKECTTHVYWRGG